MKAGVHLHLDIAFFASRAARRLILPTLVLGMACSSSTKTTGPAGSGGTMSSGGSAGGGTGGATGGTAGKAAGGKGGAGGTAGSTGGSSTGGGAGMVGEGGEASGGESGMNDAGGTGGAGGAGGSSGTLGGSGMGGSSGDGGTAGLVNGGSGGTAGNGGSAGDGVGGVSGTGGVTGGTSGAGGSGGTGSTVHGKVINHWRRPVPNVPVMIGDQMDTTDSFGEFQISNVSDTYDVHMVVTFSRYTNTQAQYGWVYEGLTRRDPTLQVYEGLPLRNGDFEFTPTNVASPGSRVLIAALGGEFGNWNREGTGAVQTGMSWYGPSPVTMNGHGLLFTETSGLPTAYHAYATTSSPVEIADGTVASWGLDMSDNSVTSVTISGSVTSPTSSDRTNNVFLQFSSNATIPLLTHYGSGLGSSFAYTVPSLPNAAITLSAHEGTGFFGAAAVAHQDVAVGQSSIELDIPSPTVLLAPPVDTTWTPSTTFSWNGSAETYVWHAESTGWYEGVYVVTSRSEITMPEFPNGWAIRYDAMYDYYWRVETHGDPQSVDEMAGPAGFIDEFGYSQGDEPAGPNQVSGTFTLSSSRTFMKLP